MYTSPVHTYTEGTCTSTMYGSAQCDVYICTPVHTYILKVCVHLQCMVVHSVMCIHVHTHIQSQSLKLIFTYSTNPTCTCISILSDLLRAGKSPI